jgi:hypothetical protein
MHITELGLTAASLAALEAIELTDTEKLIAQPADDLLAPTAQIGPMELYEIICRLNEHGYSLPPVPGGPIKVPAQECRREMLRLRIIDGLTLVEIGRQTGVSSERVRRLLRLHFGLSATPTAVHAYKRSRRRPKL